MWYTFVKNRHRNRRVLQSMWMWMFSFIDQYKQPLLKHGQRVSTKKRVAVSSLMVLITLVQNVLPIVRIQKKFWRILVIWMSQSQVHTMDNQTWPLLPFFVLLKLSDHVICIKTYGNSFPTPQTTILRPIFYWCNTFDRV